ncbi:neuronal pentraxin-2-like [Acropora millepora]|uniref:neuronal pentraxin-2-like n=1 Tax=Acropora millepora TaxID=45264 RepID=UPI001CF50BC3|nr:neuronal pentraxin-2-like [Acropora millepora]
MAVCQKWIVLTAVIVVLTLMQQPEEVKGWKKSLDNKLNKYIKRISAIEDCKLVDCKKGKAIPEVSKRAKTLYQLEKKIKKLEQWVDTVEKCIPCKKVNRREKKSYKKRRQVVERKKAELDKRITRLEECNPCKTSGGQGQSSQLLGAAKPTTNATTKATTEATTEAATKATTEATKKMTTKATTEATTKATTEATTKATTQTTTKATALVTTQATTKETTTEAAKTTSTPKATSEPNTNPTTKPKDSSSKCSEYIYGGNVTKRLNALSVCLWVKHASIENGSFEAYLSYAVPLRPLMMTFGYIGGYFEVTLFGKRGRVKADLRNNQWYHICLTWKSSEAAFNVFMNGAFLGRRNSTGRILPPNGSLYFGQHRLALNEGFTPSTCFRGSMACMNLWDYALSSLTIKSMARSCGRKGNLVNSDGVEAKSLKS